MASLNKLHYLVGLSCVVFVVLPALVHVSIRQEYPVNYDAEWILGGRNGVLVTGSSTGIGRSTVLHLARHNFTVFAGVRKDSDGVKLVSDALALDIESSHIVPVILDVVKQDQIEATLERIKQWQESSGHKLVGVVNNAGVVLHRPQECAGLDDVKWLFDVNLFGAISVSQAFTPLLRQSHGRLVHVSSIAGHISAPISGFYSATKFALEAIADAQRRELLRWGISVSIIEPGYVQTPIEGKDKGVVATTNPADALSEECRKLYAPYFENFYENRKNLFRSARGPEETAATILSALVEKYPSTRYVTGHVGGLPAWVMDRLNWIMPDRLADIVLKASGRIK